MIRIERNGTTVLLFISRPEKRNALSHQMLLDLRAALYGIERDASIRAVILSGDGEVFSSGGDLQELRVVTSDSDTRNFAALGGEVCSRIESLPVPVIAAIPGPAYGGGAEIALACDVRIGDDRTKISFKHARMGTTPAWGTMRRLTSIVGHATAARLLFTAQEIGALECRALRLLDYVADKGTSVTLALAWASDIAQGSPAAIREMKQLLLTARTSPSDLPHAELESFVSTWTGAEHQEAVAAYFERRNASWMK